MTGPYFEHFLGALGIFLSVVLFLCVMYVVLNFHVIMADTQDVEDDPPPERKPPSWWVKQITKEKREASGVKLIFQEIREVYPVERRYWVKSSVARIYFTDLDLCRFKDLSLTRVEELREYVEPRIDKIVHLTQKGEL